MLRSFPSYDNNLHYLAKIVPENYLPWGLSLSGESGLSTIFRGENGAIYDSDDLFIGSYEKNKQFSISGRFYSGESSYYVNNVLVKNNFSINNSNFSSVYMTGDSFSVSFEVETPKPKLKVDSYFDYKDSSGVLVFTNTGNKNAKFWFDESSLKDYGYETILNFGYNTPISGNNVSYNPIYTGDLSGEVFKTGFLFALAPNQSGSLRYSVDNLLENQFFFKTGNIGYFNTPYVLTGIYDIYGLISEVDYPVSLNYSNALSTGLDVNSPTSISYGDNLYSIKSNHKIFEIEDSINSYPVNVQMKLLGSDYLGVGDSGFRDNLTGDMIIESLKRTDKNAIPVLTGFVEYYSGYIIDDDYVPSVTYYIPPPGYPDYNEDLYLDAGVTAGGNGLGYIGYLRRSGIVSLESGITRPLWVDTGSPNTKIFVQDIGTGYCWTVQLYDGSTPRQAMSDAVWPNPNDVPLGPYFINTWVAGLNVDSVDGVTITPTFGPSGYNLNTSTWYLSGTTGFYNTGFLLTGETFIQPFLWDTGLHKINWNLIQSGSKNSGDPQVFSLTGDGYSVVVDEFDNVNKYLYYDAPTPIGLITFPSGQVETSGAYSGFLILSSPILSYKNVLENIVTNDSGVFFNTILDYYTGIYFPGELPPNMDMFTGYTGYSGLYRSGYSPFVFPSGTMFLSGNRFLTTGDFAGTPFVPRDYVIENIHTKDLVTNNNYYDFYAGYTISVESLIKGANFSYYPNTVEFPSEGIYYQPELRKIVISGYVNDYYFGMPLVEFKYWEETGSYDVVVTGYKPNQVSVNVYTGYNDEVGNSGYYWSGEIVYTGEFFDGIRETAQSFRSTSYPDLSDERFGQKSNTGKFPSYYSRKSRSEYDFSFSSAEADYYNNRYVLNKTGYAFLGSGSLPHISSSPNLDTILECFFTGSFYNSSLGAVRNAIGGTFPNSLSDAAGYPCYVGEKFKRRQEVVSYDKSHSIYQRIPFSGQISGFDIYFTDHTALLTGDLIEESALRPFEVYTGINQLEMNRTNLIDNTGVSIDYNSTGFGSFYINVRCNIDYYTGESVVPVIDFN